jgi:hypothetical protein
MSGLLRLYTHIIYAKKHAILYEILLQIVSFNKLLMQILMHNTKIFLFCMCQYIEITKEV